MTNSEQLEQAFEDGLNPEWPVPYCTFVGMFHFWHLKLKSNLSMFCERHNISIATRYDKGRLSRIPTRLKRKGIFNKCLADRVSRSFKIRNALYHGFQINASVRVYGKSDEDRWNTDELNREVRSLMKLCKEVDDTFEEYEKDGRNENQT